MSSRSSATPPRSLQDRAVSAIISGDLDSFKSLNVGPLDVNRRLSQHRDLDYTPKYNPAERYPRPRGPTMPILAILCEQDSILDYILENTYPDLSVRVDGRTALHYAALLKTHRPLQLLIQYQDIQENINEPIEQPNVPSAFGNFTTALHVAVSNGRLANVFLLLSEFPAYKKLPRPKRLPKVTEEPPDQLPYQVANVDQRAASGSTPLFIATFVRDFRTVEVLLVAGADPTIENDEGQNAVKLAANNKAREQKRGKPGVATQIADLIQNPPNTDFETLREKYAQELTPAVFIEGLESDGEEQTPGTGEENITKKKKGGKKIEQLYRAIKDLSMRVAKIEQYGIGKPGGQEVIIETSLTCQACGDGIGGRVSDVPSGVVWVVFGKDKHSQRVRGINLDLITETRELQFEDFLTCCVVAFA
jgi:hypothetical protein